MLYKTNNLMVTIEIERVVASKGSKMIRTPSVIPKKGGVRWGSEIIFTWHIVF